MTTEERKIQTIVKNANKRAMDLWGDGWRRLSEDQRRAAVCDAAMHHIAGTDPDHVTALSAKRMIAVAQAILAADYT